MIWKIGIDQYKDQIPGETQTKTNVNAGCKIQSTSETQTGPGPSTHNLRFVHLILFACNVRIFGKKTTAVVNPTDRLTLLIHDDTFWKKIPWLQTHVNYSLI